MGECVDGKDEAGILEKLIHEEIKRFIGNVSKLRMIYNFLRACK